MPDTQRPILSIKQKALAVNLDSTIYGTLAEIGAGQEVARNFFRVGGASGTIAKSMSAYDMAFSDAIYGDSKGRYVSEDRVLKMLDHEYDLLVERLQGEKYCDSRFFAFADTVTTLNYSRTNQPHGWIGMRFQLDKDKEPNDIVLHVRPYDNNAELQQKVLGELGVNLIYACYNYDDPELIVKSLFDSLSTDHLEIDMLRVSGPDFEEVDNRLLSLILVKKGFTNATIFGPNKDVFQAKDFLYKKDALILRGRFRPVTLVNQDMLDCALRQFEAEEEVDKDKIVVLAEMTLNNLYTGEEGEQSRKDFLDRAEILCSLGYHVMISNFDKHYKLADYMTRCRVRNTGIVLGVMNLIWIYGLAENHDKSKQILSSFGQLFCNNIKIYAYPYQRSKGDEIITVQNLRTTPQLEHLHKHFLANGFIEDIKEYKEAHLQIFSDDIIKQIKAGEDSWEKLVPPHVADLIKRNCLFDYPCEWIPPKKDFSLE